MIVNGELQGRGYIPRDYATMPVGCRSAAPRYDPDIIPRSEWSGRIKQMEETKSKISDMIRRSGMPPLNQGNTNFCWGNAPTNGVRVHRATMNEPFVDLSPASVCCPVNGYRNDGGWGLDAVQYISDNGVASTATWPANAISRQYDNPASQADRIKHKFLRWGDVDTSSKAFDKVASLVLRGWPCPVGFTWWSHEVLAVDLVEISPGVYGLRVYNSWGLWSDNGFGVLTESKGRPDDMQVCFSSTVSPE